MSIPLNPRAEVSALDKRLALVTDLLKVLCRLLLVVALLMLI